MTPSQVRDAAANDEAWIIWFEDAGMPPETFTGYGATEAARKRFDMVRSNWNCHLFRRVEADCGVEQTACLSGIASGEPCEPSAENLKRCRICGFIIDTNFAAEKPSVDFSMRGRGSGPVAPPQLPDGLMEDMAKALGPFARAFSFVDDRIRGEAAFDFRGALKAITFGDLRKADEVLDRYAAQKGKTVALGDVKEGS